MKLLQLTPGTGNFFCGSCIRDNAMVLAMRGMGHDVMMAPMYLPHLVDEPEAALKDRLFLGGLNVYLQQKLKIFRFTPAWLDWLFNGKWLLKRLAGLSSSTSANELGEMTVSMLRGEDGGQKREIEKLVQWIGAEGRFDAILLSNCMLSGMIRAIKAEVDTPVIVTLQGEDSFLDSMPQPYRDEAWGVLSERVRDADGVIAVSDYYGREMARRLSLEEGVVQVVRNGITLDGYHDAAELPEVPTVGFLSRMIFGKGLQTLVDAFILLKQKPGMADAKLKVAGSCVGPDLEFVKDLREQLDEAGVSGDVEWLPNIDREEKMAFLRSISVMSVPATYGESFGLYVVEAMAMGVPVVQPRCAGFVEVVEDTGGGVLCEPDDAEDLAATLARVLADREQLKAMGLRGREAVFDRYSSKSMAEGVLRVVEGVVARYGAGVEADATARGAG